MLRGKYKTIIDICNYILGQSFKETMEDIYDDIKSTGKEFEGLVCETLSALDEQLNELQEEISDTRDTIASINGELKQLNAEKQELLSEQEELTNPDSAAEAAVTAVVAVVRLPIIVARLAAIDLQIPQLVAQKAQAEAELVKLEICLAKQIAYIELCKGKSIKYIAEIELLAKRTNKKLIDLQDDLMAKAAKCRSCLESFVNLSNSATQKKLPEDSFMFVSCDALEDELKNISSIGGSIDSNNSLLEKQRKSFFENQDIIFENTSNNVIGNNKEIVILLKEMSVIYDCLRKMLSLLQEYDQI